MSLLPPCPSPRPLPYTTLFRSAGDLRGGDAELLGCAQIEGHRSVEQVVFCEIGHGFSLPFIPYDSALAVTQSKKAVMRSEEHTSELQSRENLVCRLLLEKKTYE